MSSVTCLLRGEDAIRKMGSTAAEDERGDPRARRRRHARRPAVVGEIVYRGPTVFQLLGNPAATAEVSPALVPPGDLRDGRRGLPWSSTARRT